MKVLVKEMRPSASEDGKVYKAELWMEDGKLKVRGYLGPFFKTRTRAKGD